MKSHFIYWVVGRVIGLCGLLLTVRFPSQNFHINAMCQLDIGILMQRKIWMLDVIFFPFIVVLSIVQKIGALPHRMSPPFKTKQNKLKVLSLSNFVTQTLILLSLVSYKKVELPNQSIHTPSQLISDHISHTTHLPYSIQLLLPSFPHCVTHSSLHHIVHHTSITYICHSTHSFALSCSKHQASPILPPN